MDLTRILNSAFLNLKSLSTTPPCVCVCRERDRGMRKREGPRNEKKRDSFLCLFLLIYFRWRREQKAHFYYFGLDLMSFRFIYHFRKPLDISVPTAAQTFSKYSQVHCWLPRETTVLRASSKLSSNKNSFSQLRIKENRKVSRWTKQSSKCLLSKETNFVFYLQQTFKTKWR